MSDIYFFVGGYVWGLFTAWLLYAKRRNKIKHQRKDVFKHENSGNTHNYDHDQFFYKFAWFHDYSSSSVMMISP